jgi:hypothetical protein
MSTIEKKSLKVGKYVNTEHVDTLIRNYKTERWMQNSERIGKEDSISLWWTADELEEFIQTSKIHGADGIRVCFGVYGEKGGRAGMEGKMTVALVATASEVDAAGNVYPRDVYVERDGVNTILAYNLAFPPVGPATYPPPASVPLGTVMVADKENGLRVI